MLSKLITDKIKKIEYHLPKAMAAERAVLRRRINRLKRAKAGSLPEGRIKSELAVIEKQLASSIKKKQQRAKNLPSPVFNEELPITAHKNEIIDSIGANQVVIISGETGSGKTTQLPKFCLAAHRGIDGLIACTQPRRIAAITVANRIAEELGEETGRTVGYKIRFTDKTSPDGYIKIMTDGILLAETHGDPDLTRYDTIIVDEAHERSLNIDFILGVLKTLLKKRKDLKVIITSATIDTEKFSKAFDNAPVVEVSGRMYPVEVKYFLPEPDAKNEQTHVELAALAVDRLQKKSPSGDILVFMPTEQDIRETCELIEGRKYPRVIILPLFARLSAPEQAKVFSRPPGRKIIIATNIAETSITIPEIKYVIDTGLARISQYSPRSRITSLPVVPISQSSADQRKGRCGRVENGVCLRLYSEEDYLTRPLYTPPEILRANLAEVILRMIALKLGELSDFPFIDRPADKSIRDGFDLLLELGAIKSRTLTAEHKAQWIKNKGLSTEENRLEKKPRFRLTATGRMMAKMPIDPRLARMLIEAQKERCLKEVAILASALSIQDPRERPAEKAEEADRIHSEFNDPSSDFLTLLNIWNRYHDTWKKVKTTNQVKKFCREHYLSFKRMREWRDIHAQISAILEECGLTPGQPSTPQPIVSEQEEFSPRYAAIHKSILSGFLTNIALKKEKNIFTATKGKEVMVFPGSGLFNKAGKWIVAAEIVETARIFVRTVANIDSAWLEEIGRDQCKYTYHDPHWARNRGEVVAFEQVSLGGLIIADKRPVSYGPIDPDKASDIFIRSALVEGDVKRPFPFMIHNQKVAASIRKMEDKIRRRDLLISEDEIFMFYKSKLPKIYDLKTLQHFIKKQGTDSFLRMKQEDLLRKAPDETKLAMFPDRISLGSRKYECTYRFDPGQDDDGVTIKVPLSAAAAVPAETIDWLVPGLYREKLTALIKGLPKEYRKQLVPISDTVEVIINEMPRSESSLLTELGKFIFNRFGVDIPAAAWPDNLLPDHLKARIAITDPHGRQLGASRDKSILYQYTSHQVNGTESVEFKEAKKKWEKTGITRWDFGDLPDTIEVTIKGKIKLALYPGLAPEDKSVSLRLFQRREQAVKSHKEGVATLFALHFSKDLKVFKKSLALPKSAKQMADHFGGLKQVEKRMYEKVFKSLFYKNIRTETEFYNQAEAAGSSLQTSGQKLLARTMPVLEAYHETSTLISRLAESHRFSRQAWQFLQDLRYELTKLVPDNFIDLYDPDRYEHLVRYVKAIAIRGQRALVNFDKDLAKAKEVKVYTDKLNELLKGLSPMATAEKRNAIEEFFWLIEEYKVSLFAQELKTPLPVSPKRLNKRLKEIERMI